MGSIQPGALTPSVTPQFNPITILPRNSPSSAPKTIDGLVASVPTSTADLARRLLAGMVGAYRKQQQFGNAAVREHTFAMTNRPRTIQRGVASDGTQQSMQQQE
jgi:hypothetical protein